MLLYIGVHRSEMEEFTPLSLKTNGLDVRNLVLAQHVVPRLSVMIRKARCYGNHSLRCAVPMRQRYLFVLYLL